MRFMTSTGRDVLHRVSSVRYSRDLVRNLRPSETIEEWSQFLADILDFAEAQNRFKHAEGRPRSTTKRRSLPGDSPNNAILHSIPFAKKRRGEPRGKKLRGQRRHSPKRSSGRRCGEFWADAFLECSTSTKTRQPPASTGGSWWLSCLGASAARAVRSAVRQVGRQRGVCGQVACTNHWMLVSPGLGLHSQAIRNPIFKPLRGSSSKARQPPS